MRAEALSEPAHRNLHPRVHPPERGEEDAVVLSGQTEVVADLQRRGRHGATVDVVDAEHEREQRDHVERARQSLRARLRSREHGATIKAGLGQRTQLA